MMMTLILLPAGDSKTQGVAQAAAIVELGGALTSALWRWVINPFTVWSGLAIKSVKLMEHCGFYHPEPAQGCSAVDGQ